MDIRSLRVGMVTKHPKDGMDTKSPKASMDTKSPKAGMDTRNQRDTVEIRLQTILNRNVTVSILRRKTQSPNLSRDFSGPDPRGIIHFGNSEHHYWLSWRAGWKDMNNAQQTWLNASKICQSQCMALVSIESPEENEMLLKVVADGNIYGAWTGGRQCREKGCEDSNGLFQWVFEPTKRLFKNLDFLGWSDTGATGNAQPDNFTGQEKCMAVLSDVWYGGGEAWHDIECRDKMPFICEDPVKLQRSERRSK